MVFYKRKSANKQYRTEIYIVDSTIDSIGSLQIHTEVGPWHKLNVQISKHFTFRLASFMRLSKISKYLYCLTWSCAPSFGDIWFQFQYWSLNMQISWFWLFRSDGGPLRDDQIVFTKNSQIKITLKQNSVRNHVHLLFKYKRLLFTFANVLIS